jgi:serine/threonine protein kinase
VSQDAVDRETAGRFTLYRKLPAGGMGRVFEAEDPVGPRRVALKLIDLGTDPDSLQIVAAERLGAELQTRLCAIDKRVTAIFESGEMPRYFYIVMEYVDGRDLSELYTANGRWPRASHRTFSRFWITPITFRRPSMAAPFGALFMVT